MSEIDPSTVVKWIFIVLAAGFVGQFGKTFAQYLMRRTREKAAGRKMPAEESVIASSEPKPLHPEKMDSGTEIEIQGQASGAAFGISDEKAEKKAARAKKKEIKLLKKMFK
ncbi:MAG: hypothetical protein NTV99_08835 [Deltaproteobacteria bacterium]|nr:hypothetical protein [Deltaproteobacteria bacterium]